MTILRWKPPVPLLLLSVFLTTCGGGHSPLTAALKPVRVNVSVNFHAAALRIAQEEGFFRAEGIEPILLNVDSNSALMALIAGKLDVFAGPMRAGMFNLIARRQPVQIVADYGHIGTACTTDAFVAPPDIAAKIAQAGSIRGERVSTTRGGGMEYMLDRYLQKEHP